MPTYKKLGPKTYFVGPAQARSPAFPRVSETIFYNLRYVTVGQLRDLLPDWVVEYVRLAANQPYALIAAPIVYRDDIIQIIQKIDQPPVQVVLSALVTEFTEEAGKELKVGWDWQTTRSPLTAAGTPPAEGFSDVRGNQQELGSFIQNLTVTRTGEYTNRLLATLNDLVSSGKAKIRANPAVIAQNGKEATMEIGLEQYYKIETGTVAFPRVELQKIQSGTILKLTPQVADNGDITLDLAPEVNDVIATGAEGLPTIQKRSVKSTVRVRDGEMVIIGGMIEEREQTEERKVPFFGSVPVIKYLFRGTRKATTRKQVAIFIMPRIIKEGQPPTDLSAMVGN
ncbi:type II and III secretion system protein [Candidatus Poribacteria bacterium]|nr:type II and III secretion system protein [Candidatus Poribacteria bacterium]